MMRDACVQLDSHPYSSAEFFPEWRLLRWLSFIHLLTQKKRVLYLRELAPCPGLQFEYYTLTWTIAN